MNQILPLSFFPFLLIMSSALSFFSHTILISEFSEVQRTMNIHLNTL